MFANIVRVSTAAHNKRGFEKEIRRIPTAAHAKRGRAIQNSKCGSREKRLHKRDKFGRQFDLQFPITFGDSRLPISRVTVKSRLIFRPGLALFPDIEPGRL